MSSKRYSEHGRRPYLPCPLIDSTITAFPANQYIQECAGVPWSIILQPLAKIANESKNSSSAEGIPQCDKCGAFINCFIKFAEGNRWICSLCGETNSCSAWYLSDGHIDTSKREFKFNVFEAELNVGADSLRSYEVSAYVEHVRELFISHNIESNKRKFIPPSFGDLPPSSPISLSKAIEENAKQIRGHVLQSLLSPQGRSYTKYLSGLACGGAVVAPSFFFLLDASSDGRANYKAFEKIKEALVAFLDAAPSTCWVGLATFSKRLDVYDFDDTNGNSASYVSLGLLGETWSAKTEQNWDLPQLGKIFGGEDALKGLDRLLFPLSKCRNVVRKTIQSLKPHQPKYVEHASAQNQRCFGHAIYELISFLKKVNYQKLTNIRLKVFLRGSPNVGYGSLPPRESLTIRHFQKLSESESHFTARSAYRNPSSALPLSAMAQLMVPNLEQRLPRVIIDALMTWKPKRRSRELLATIFERDRRLVSEEVPTKFLPLRQTMWSVLKSTAFAVKDMVVKRFAGEKEFLEQQLTVSSVEGDISEESDEEINLVGDYSYCSTASNQNELHALQANDVFETKVASFSMENCDNVDDACVLEEFRRLSLDCQADLRLVRVAQTQPQAMPHIFMRSVGNGEDGRTHGNFYAGIGVLAADAGVIIDLYCVGDFDECSQTPVSEVEREDRDFLSELKELSDSSPVSIEHEHKLPVHPKVIAKRRGLHFDSASFDCASLSILPTITCGFMRRFLLPNDPKDMQKTSSTTNIRQHNELRYNLSREVQNCSLLASKCLIRVRVPPDLKVKRVRGPVLPDTRDSSLFHAPSLHDLSTISLDLDFGTEKVIQDRQPNYVIQTVTAYTKLFSVPKPKVLLSRLARAIEALNSLDISLLSTPNQRSQAFTQCMVEEQNRDGELLPIDELEDYVPMRKIRVVTAKFPRVFDIGDMLRSVKVETTMCNITRSLLSHSFVQSAIIAHRAVNYHGFKRQNVHGGDNEDLSSKLQTRHKKMFEALGRLGGAGLDNIRTKLARLRRRLPPLSLPAKFRRVSKENEDNETIEKPPDSTNVTDNVIIEMSQNWIDEERKYESDEFNDDATDPNSELNSFSDDYVKMLHISDRRNPLTCARQAAEEWLLKLLVMYHEQMLGVTSESRNTRVLEVEFESLKHSQIGIIPRLIHALLQHPALTTESVMTDARVVASISLINAGPQLLSSSIYPLLASFEDENVVSESSIALSSSALFTSCPNIIFLASPSQPIILDLRHPNVRKSPDIEKSAIYKLALRHYFESLDQLGMGGGFSPTEGIISFPILENIHCEDEQKLMEIVSNIRHSLVEDGTPSANIVSYIQFREMLAEELKRILFDKE